MTDQHVKGTINKTVGKVEEAAGKVSGDRKLESRGKVKQVQGVAQEGLGDVQDAIRKAANKS